MCIRDRTDFLFGPRRLRRRRLRYSRARTRLVQSAHDRLRQDRALPLGFPAATGAFTSLLNQIGLAAKLITSRVRRAGLANVLGYTGQTNVQGEQVQKLDDEANETLINALARRGTCLLYTSPVGHVLR